MTNARTARDWSLAAPGLTRHGGGQALRGRVDQRRGGARRSASTPTTCSASGTGWAAATRWTRRSGCRPCSPSGRTASTRCWPASTPWTSTSARRRSTRNLPVLLGLLGVWYGDFFGAQTDAVLPVRPVPHRFPAYLQQLDMESNGKHVTLDGGRVDYETGPIYLGRAGHQRPARLLPADPPGHAARSRATSSASCTRSTRSGEHQDLLIANVFAQTEALAFGKTAEQVARRGRPGGRSSRTG